MKCEEPLFQEDTAYPLYYCLRDLRHPGDHEDARGRRYPRVVACGLDEDLNDLITAGHNVGRDLYDLDEREFPVVVETTTRYVVWVSAESEDDALHYVGDDPTDLELSHYQAIDGDIEVQRMDRHLVTEAYASRHHGSKIGPEIACPDCGALAFRREWFHDPYRRCHGPIQWRESRIGRPRRDFHATPVHTPKAVTA